MVFSFGGLAARLDGVDFISFLWLLVRLDGLDLVEGDWIPG